MYLVIEYYEEEANAIDVMNSDQKNPSHSICVTHQHLFWLDRRSEVKELLHTIANERGLDFHTDYEKILEFIDIVHYYEILDPENLLED